MTVRPQSLPRRGFTLIETMVAVVIFGVLAAIAVPSMLEFIARKRVEGAVDELLVDFRQARTSQMAINGKVVIRFNSNSEMTCYSIFERTNFGTCDCRNTETPVCSTLSSQIPREFKTVRYPTSRKVVVAPAPTSMAELRLEGAAGLPRDLDTLEIIVSAPQGGSVRVRTNAAGVAQACSISGHGNAYKACS